KLRNNIDRWGRLKNTYREVSSALDKSSIEFAVMKGFSQFPLFVGDPRHRSQYDFDLLLRERDLDAAVAVATRLGFEPAVSSGRQPVVDHLPALVRKTGWTWRGDYFDPEIPFSLELHFRCWDRTTEGFGPEGLEQMFWQRITKRKCEELSFHALDPADSVLYASLHALRHVLRGNVRPAHVYEFAWFLQRKSNDDHFWQRWQELFTKDEREYQAVCFGLAQKWFGCPFHQIVDEAVRCLPAGVHRWLLQYSHSPISGQFKPNKDELWLHWSLLESPAQRFAVLRRRLVPHQLPGPISALHVPDHQLTLRVRMQRQWSYLRYLWKRLRHHIASLAPTCIGVAIWLRDNWRDRAVHLRSPKP
ncbi:MAG: nucleotidyltransferase family protein, partial [Bryobacteraceae bacterium]